MCDWLSLPITCSSIPFVVELLMFGPMCCMFVPRFAHVLAEHVSYSITFGSIFDIELQFQCEKTMFQNKLNKTWDYAKSRSSFISFIIRGSNIVFSNYPTLQMVLVVVQSYVNSHVVVGVCFFHVMRPMPACLELHIVLLKILQFMLLIIHKGRPRLQLVSLLEN
jgi:hypothetical protein